MRGTTGRALAVLLALVAAACAGASVEEEPTAEDEPVDETPIEVPEEACDPPVVESVLEFDDEGTAEGAAVSQDGDIFVGNFDTGEIWHAPKGAFDDVSLLAQLPGGNLIGMDVDEVGNLYAAVAAFEDPDLHGLWRVQTDGTSERVAALPPPPSSLPNDVTVDPRGNVYVSDSFDARIWRLTSDGELSVWIQDDLLQAFFEESEFGVNGLVYHESALYGAITLNGRVVEIPIQPDGAAGTPEILVEDEALVGIDGIEPDMQGNLYVTNNFQSTIQVVRVDDLEIETITDESLSAPASLAFDNNQEVIYIANLSTSASFPQPYAPALVQMKFSAPVVDCSSFN